MLSLTVGYQGVAGSFSEEALYNYFPNDVDTKNFEQFEDVFIGLDKGVIHYGVLPIENSSTGAISAVYDLLNQYDCFIVGETYVKPIQNLLGIKGSKMTDLKEVYSHPQGFEQSKTFLSSYQWKLIPYYNTARSAEYIKEQNNITIGAIASKKAAELYGLDILAENINCNQHNTTRFVIIGKSLKVNNVCDKISVVLSTKHQAGALYNTLKHFASNNINLLKIESRPVQHTPWEYYFYIDFEGNVDEPYVAKTIEQMKIDCHHFKLLGNYKKQIKD
ncbi:MAG: bifunctional chorismate mutase/prephenate dehydratase [Firmicutes bacterium HGW-Firmicutes-1]|jgi:chorismate mutase/prephenate dehydratase|nr:MAG: bifunctional chorismate mutase/prephenate dehydratase [Firmicutes bacterium HGW-Firmicutes-1]